MHSPDGHRSETDDAETQDDVVPPSMHSRPPTQEGESGVRAEEGDDDAGDDDAGVGLKGDGVDTVVKRQGGLV